MSKRLRLFCIFLAVGVFLYLVDCLIYFKEHPDLPWYERGIDTAPHGFPLTVAVFVLAFVVLLFKKD